MKRAGIAVSWSGGKDSCMAFHRSSRMGYQVECLLNMVSDKFDRSCFHGIDAGILRSQAMSIGIPMIQKKTGEGAKEYDEDFRQALSEIKSRGIDTVAFGDIYGDESCRWIRRVCRDAGVMPIEPLLNASPDGIMEEFIDLGFRAVVICCKAKILGKDFIGRQVDKEMVTILKSQGICPCGEGGEYHTFVYNGPIFKKAIKIVETDTVLKDGFWKHWSLEIKRYKLI